MTMGYLTSALIGLGVGIIGTGIGSLLMTLVNHPGDRLTHGLMGVSGGVMLSLVFFDMVPEALEATGVPIAILCTLLGMGVLILLHRLLPDAHHHGAGAIDSADTAREFFHMGCLMCLGVALHNLPEGLAIGSGLALGGEGELYGIHLAVMLTVHNIIEGAALAVPLVLAETKKSRIFFLAVLAGLPMGIGAIAGYLLGGISEGVMGGIIAFGAGAMLFITLMELLPEAFHGENRLEGAASILVGMVLGAGMVFLL